MPRLNSLADLDKFRQGLVEKKGSQQMVVAVCSGTGCHALKSVDVTQAFVDEIDRQGLKDKVEIRRTGCLGFCERGPVVIIFPGEVYYTKVKPADVPDIVTALAQDKVVERLLYRGAGNAVVVHEGDIPFYKFQTRFLVGNNKFINSRKIEDYIANGGYTALSKVLAQMTPLQVIEEVKKSNLRGRGGAGFPTGQKWETTRNAPGREKYVIVNADEGDPGAFGDGSILEGNPHSVLEGLMIGAYAIGAHQGFVYVRQEYPLAVESITTALKQARAYGLLGKNILGSGFDFDVSIHQGAGAFVSGESSALMTAIEGRVGEPRPKYIRTAVSGIFDRPSNLNNVKTWATVPLIINKGAEWFNTIGTQGSKGTMVFSLVGKVNNTGLVEVPMGVTLRQVIFDIGGGIAKGKKFKAVQTGGPSGGVIPASLLDTPVDFDQLTNLGSMMGSGGMIVMDENTCMVDVARYFLNFLSGESCGKCVPCREGISQMLKILNRITGGHGREGDIELLEEIGETMRGFSLCSLGTSAPNPVLSSLKYFRDEYEQHIKEKRCSAGVCKALVSYYIDPEKCQACLICARNCPVEAISGDKNTVHIVDQAKCTKCGTCFEMCPERFNAVVKVPTGKVPAGVARGTAVARK
ncbi:MAG TPA: NADH-quinone oxidoreductase subunit NuoF [Dehalococcoidales bacterium]|jgi:NADH-quinone oxidoreductase subunit F